MLTDGYDVINLSAPAESDHRVISHEDELADALAVYDRCKADGLDVTVVEA